MHLDNMIKNTQMEKIRKMCNMNMRLRKLKMRLNLQSTQSLMIRIGAHLGPTL